MEQIDGAFTLNKTVQEIITACQSQTVLFSYASEGPAAYAPLGGISVSSQGTVQLYFGQMLFYATTVNDYPTLST